MKGNEGPKAKMKGNEGPKGQKGKKKQKMTRGPRQLNLLCKNANLKGFLASFGGGPTDQPRRSSNMKKCSPRRPKYEEMQPQKAKMKAHKANMQGNEGPKDQNERK